MRTFSSKTESEITNTVTRPVYIIELGYAQPVRICSRGAMVYGGFSYSEGILNVDLKNKKLQIYNENLVYSSVFTSQLTSGISCKIWQLYGDAPFTTGDADQVFDGELGGAVIGEWISLNLLPHAVIYAPRLYATAPTFNHIPPSGLEISTPYGLYKLESN